jgi:virginiamycin A acetyltransferase
MSDSSAAGDPVQEGTRAPSMPHDEDAPARRGRVLTLVGGAVGAVGAAPFVLVHRLTTRVLGEGASFRTMSETLSLIPGELGILIRRAAYERTISRCGSELSIGFGTVLTHPDIELGDHVYTGRHCLVALSRIGDDTMLADQVRVISGNHGMEPGIRMRLQASSYQRVEIGSDVWIGTGTTVLASVGDRAILGAGSVVTKPVPPGVVVAGVPAKVIRERE